MAATILIGQSTGARDLVLTKRVMGTSCVFFGVVSILIAAVGFAVAPQILHAMQTPPDAVAIAAAYLRIIFIAIPAIFLSTFMMMALRGTGDSRTPFFFMLISATLDVGLNPSVDSRFRPDARLRASRARRSRPRSRNGCGLMLLVIWLYWRRNILCIGRGEFRYFRIDAAILRSLLTKGIPMGLQVVVVSSSMILMISLVDRYGSLTVAAYGACFQLWNYIQMPAFSVGSAVSSMAAQNVGAATLGPGQPNRHWRA